VSPNPDLALDGLKLSGPVASAELIEAITGAPEVARTIDGATTLTVNIRDSRGTLLRSGIFGSRSWAVVDGINFELVKVRRTGGNTLSLVFEDAIVAALRRRTSPRTFAAETATRQQVAEALAQEANVELDADPEVRPAMLAAVERSSGTNVDSSWDVLGTLAEGAGWRRFSDGRRLVFGSDDWLRTRYQPIRLRENTDAVGVIDFDLDVGKPAATATVTLDSTRYAIVPGSPVELLAEDVGPAGGLWLAESWTRRLTRTQGTLGLVSGRPSLDEDPPEGDEDADQGDTDFVPGRETVGPVAGAVAAVASIGKAVGGSGGREKMLSYALAQQDKPYVWGASGPGSFDCSGLVQEASRAGGAVLVKPVTSQWAALKAAGKTISVDEAMRTRGALLIHLGADGSNHIAFSLGDGNTMEARGTAYGTGIFKAANRSWYTGGGLWL
jgi:cell wall-associated NlpC family hydrolase